MSMAENLNPHLEPNTTDMRRHLEFLFANVREYDDGLIEIAVRADNWRSRLFGTDEIEQAVTYAARENAAGHNVYVGQALREPDLPPFGRASDADHYVTTAAYVDLDSLEAAEKAGERTKPLPPGLIVCTGVTPHRRMHLQWRLAEPVTDRQQHREIMEGLADALGGDRSVCNPSRILRLAGSVAWPMKAGRIAEMTFLVNTPARQPIAADTLRRAYPRLEHVHTIDTGKNTPIERTGRGGLDLGTATVTDGREAYMRDTILAVLIEWIGTNGAVPTEQELYDAAWPQYSAHVDFSRPGRGPQEMAQKIRSTLRRFERGQLRALPSMEAAVARYKEKQAEEQARAQRAVGVVPPSVESAEPAAEAHDNGDLILNARGNPIWCMANALFVLRNHDDWRDVLAFNEFTGRSVLLKPIPGTTPIKGDFPRDMRDGDYTAATVWFNHAGFHSAAKQVTADALEMAAQDAVIHPVRQYLSSLVWDGKPRLKTWLQVYCGAEIRSEAHARYVQEAGFRWTISAVARIFRPGCKADAAIILEGQQGCGKSRGLKALTGDSFFGDSLPPMTTKDASTYLRGLWIIELAELSNINKAEVEHIKAFITRTEERFRPPYGRNEIAFPRQCVFAGTTNRDDYLRDDTGNRRFWPVTVTDVDVDAITEDRDQIWAEAVHYFRAGEPWHMSVDAIALAQDEQSERQADDPWADAIANFVIGRRSVSPSMVAVEGLGIDIGRVNRADQNRIVSILRQMGWKKAGRITTGRDYKGQFRYERGDA